MSENTESRRRFLQKSTAVAISGIMHSQELMPTQLTLKPELEVRQGTTGQSVEPPSPESQANIFEDLLSTLPELPDNFFGSHFSTTVIHPDDSMIEVFGLIEGGKRILDTKIYPDFNETEVYLGLSISEHQGTVYLFHESLVQNDDSCVELDDASLKRYVDDETGFVDNLSLSYEQAVDAFKRMIDPNSGSLTPTIHDALFGQAYLDFNRLWHVNWINEQSRPQHDQTAELMRLEISNNGAFSLTHTLFAEGLLEAGVQVFTGRGSVQEMNIPILDVEFSEVDNPEYSAVESTRVFDPEVFYYIS